jgi:hypothetical protein
VGEQEITLDDIWLLDLAKMDGWQLVKVRDFLSLLAALLQPRTVRITVPYDHQPAS